MNQPKYRKGQLVMLLDHNPKLGKPVKIVQIFEPYFIAGREPEKAQYEYEVSPGYGSSFFDKVHENWLRPLTGQEITGRI